MPGNPIDAQAQPQHLEVMNGRSVIRGVAAFDLLVTSLFALPVTAHLFIAALYTFEASMPPPALHPIAWFFVNLAGILGVLWAIVRLRMPLHSLAIADAVARCFVAVLIVYYVFYFAIPAVFLVFVATEILGSVLQLVAIRIAAPERGTL